LYLRKWVELDELADLPDELFGSIDFFEESSPEGDEEGLPGRVSAGANSEFTTFLSS
jgi:hypothetical protein